MNTATSQKGFSIIEVVLVLAIAGLIFLMVFIALPAVQRSQRDSARQTEVGTVVSAIGTHQSANNGRLPSTAAALAKVITGKDSSASDGSGELESGAKLYFHGTHETAFTANLDAAPAADSVITMDEITVVRGAKCVTNEDGGFDGLERGSARQAAVLAVQEIGNTGAIYCKNS